MRIADGPPVNPAPETSDDCYRCGYALRGIADERPCPECGLVAVRSRRRSDELHHTRPRWLRRVGLGAGLMLLAVLSMPAWGLALTVVEDRVLAPGGSPFGYRLWRATPSWLPFELSAAVFLAGVLFLTSREGYPPADRADRRLRWSLRAAAAVPLAVMPVAHINFDLTGTFTNFGRMPAADLLVLPLATIGCVPLPLLLFRHLRGVALRARNPRLAEHCTLVGVGTSVTLVGVAAVTVLFRAPTWFGLNDEWVYGSNVPLLLALLLYAAAALFPLWSLYLLASIAVTFSRAARRLRSQWFANDRALAIQA